MNKDFIKSLALKDFIMYLIDNDYYFQLNKDATESIVEIYNIYKVYYSESKVYFIDDSTI